MAFRVPEQYRIETISPASLGKRGAFRIPHPLQRGVQLLVIADEGTLDDQGAPLPRDRQWEHVSVQVQDPTVEKRTPTWAEMCFIKAQFWDREDTVVQLHPPRSRYVDVHPYVLHLWRQVGVEQPLPPQEYV